MRHLYVLRKASRYVVSFSVASDVDQTNGVQLYIAHQSKSRHAATVSFPTRNFYWLREGSVRLTDITNTCYRRPLLLLLQSDKNSRGRIAAVAVPPPCRHQKAPPTLQDTTILVHGGRR